MAATGVSIRKLDFLRGVAAVYVLVNHARGAFFAGGQAILAQGNATWADYVGIALLQLTSLGSEFVILFFVLSGFAMAGSLSGPSGKGNFYLKRLIRIWPPYLAAVALAAGLGFLMLALQPDHSLARKYSSDFRDWGRLLEIIFYVQPSTYLTVQFWSLPYEILFYAICPFLLVNRKIISIGLIVSILFAIAGTAAYGAALFPSRMLIVDFIIHGLLFFMSGAFLFHNLDRVPRLSGKQLAVTVATTFLIAYALKMWIGTSNIFSSLSMIAMTATLVRNLPERVAESRFNLGHFSYSIYIYHYQLIMFSSFILLVYFGMPQEGMTSYVAWILAVPPLLAICFLLYEFTERPCNKLVATLRKRGSSGQIRVARA